MRTPKLQLPQTILESFTFLQLFDTGGSTASTFLVENRAGKRLILKYSDWDGIGHNGAPWVEAQTKRLEDLKRLLPDEAADWLPTVYEAGRHGAAYYALIEYFEHAKPLSEHYSQHTGDVIEPYLADIDSLLSFFGEYMYPLGSVRTPASYVQTTHIDRVRYRFSLFAESGGETYERYVKGKRFSLDEASHEDMSRFFCDLFEHPTIVINGKKYSGTLRLLANLERDDATLRRLTPTFLPEYTHGDANLRNFLKTPDGILKIIDLRGSSQSIRAPEVCIPYDLGKVLHTVWVDAIRSNNFTMDARRTEQGLAFTFKINQAGKNIADLLEVRQRMPGLIKHNKALKPFLGQEPDWYEQALLAEACHILADTINRLEQDSTGRHSLAYYLLGTILLNDLRAERLF